MSRLSQMLFYLSICLCIPGCNAKKVDVSLDTFSVNIHNVYFRGVQPDIDYSQLVEIMGEPMEYLNLSGDDDEREHSPIYYLNDGKIICHWGGDEDELMGMIEFIPYDSHPLYLETLVFGQMSDYCIKPTTKFIRVYQDDVLYYRLLVENYRITNIEYWMIRRGFLNVAY